MQIRELSFSYGVYEDKYALPLEDQKLIDESIRAGSMAYAPYSNFKVGVAIRTLDQKISIGSNQENGAFPIGQCGERVALFNMVQEYGRLPIDTIAIVVDSDHQNSPASPCGACRQILNEYRSHQSNPMRLLLTLAQGGEVYEIKDVKDLLPIAFDGSFLGQ